MCVRKGKQHEPIPDTLRQGEIQLQDFPNNSFLFPFIQFLNPSKNKIVKQNKYTNEEICLDIFWKMAGNTFCSSYHFLTLKKYCSTGHGDLLFLSGHRRRPAWCAGEIMNHRAHTDQWEKGDRAEVFLLSRDWLSVKLACRCISQTKQLADLFVKTCIHITSPPSIPPFSLTPTVLKPYLPK